MEIIDLLAGDEIRITVPSEDVEECVDTLEDSGYEILLKIPRESDVDILAATEEAIEREKIRREAL